jgi:putative membrane protein
MFNTARPVFAFGWVFGVIFWILFICLVVGLVRWYVSDNHKNSQVDEEGSPERAIDILKERYVKGEITKKEFLEMKKDIE